MNTQTMISYLQSSVDKRANGIKNLWDIHQSYIAFIVEAKTTVPDCVGYWKSCINSNMKSIKYLEQKQKIEKKLIAELISLNYYRKHGIYK